VLVVVEEENQTVKDMKKYLGEQVTALYEND